MTDGEIRGFYRDSKNKKTAISFLMDMTGHSKKEILEILKTGGYDVSEIKLGKEEEIEHTWSFDEEKALELYNSGKGDSAIAAECKVTRMTIYNWRHAKNLKSKYAEEKNKKKNKIIELYKKGMTDRQIAEELEVTPQSVAMVRNKYNLKPNKKAAQLAL